MRVNGRVFVHQPLLLPQTIDTTYFSENKYKKKQQHNYYSLVDQCLDIRHARHPPSHRHEGDRINGPKKASIGQSARVLPPGEPHLRNTPPRCCSGS